MNDQSEFDLARAVPELAELRQLVGRMEYAELTNRLEHLAVEAPSDLTVASDFLAGSSELAAHMQRRLNQEPTDVAAKHLRAHRLILRAWETRGRSNVEFVSDQQFTSFQAQLRNAELELLQLCATAPGSSWAWFLRLLTARGLELGIGESRRRYDRLVELHPVHPAAQRQFLQVLCPKWGGTWDQVFEFVTECRQAAPDGSTAHALVAHAHFERWASSAQKEATAYLRAPAIQEELRNAADASVFSPAYQRGFDWVETHTAFAFVRAFGGDERGASRHFDALGPFLDRRLSDYLVDHRLVDKLRLAALQRASR